MRNHIIEVGASEILQTAICLVHSARKTIRVTMNAAEEIEHPLPHEYFLLLQKKMDAEVLIQRIGFGAEEDFRPIKNRVEIDHAYYEFHHAKSQEYRRMLLVDDQKLLLAKRDEGSNHYFYTEDEETVEYYKKYFQSCWEEK